MACRVGGARRKTRTKFSKSNRDKGKVSLRAYFQELKAGERVALKAEPAIHQGLYFRRFHGQSGIVGRKLGECYEVLIEDGGKTKHLIVHAVHLKRT